MSDAAIAVDEKTQKLVEESTDNGKKKTTPTIARQLAHFLVDFRVVSTGISLLIALQFQLFMQAFVNFIFLRVLKVEHDSVLTTLAALLLTLLLCFLFVRFVFYKFIYTEDVAKETILKQAIQEKKKEVAKQKVEQQPEVQKEIEAKTDLKVEKMTDGEHFTNYTQYPW